MAKTIALKEVLQLHWMDGAKLSGGAYANEPSLNADEALAEISRLLEEAKPSMQDTRGITQNPNNPNSLTRRAKAFNEGVASYSANIERIVG